MINMHAIIQQWAKDYPPPGRDIWPEDQRLDRIWELEQRVYELNVIVQVAHRAMTHSGVALVSPEEADGLPVLLFRLELLIQRATS